jgi:hypothetical protein
MQNRRLRAIIRSAERSAFWLEIHAARQMLKVPGGVELSGTKLAETTLAVARGRLEARLDRLPEVHYRSPVNERFANHLRRERNYIFTFLYCPGLDAANYLAEQAMRPTVVTRKVWGGNRTPVGAHAREILASVLPTSHQRGLSAQAVVIHLLCPCGTRSLGFDRLRPSSALRVRAIIPPCPFTEQFFRLLVVSECAI